MVTTSMRLFSQRSLEPTYQNACIIYFIKKIILLSWKMITCVRVCVCVCVCVRVCVCAHVQIPHHHLGKVPVPLPLPSRPQVRMSEMSERVNTWIMGLRFLFWESLMSAKHESPLTFGNQERIIWSFYIKSTSRSNLTKQADTLIIFCLQTHTGRLLTT